MNQSFYQVQVSCDYLEHVGNPITSLCTRPQCKFKSACCFECVPQFHENCLKYQKFVKDIPKLIEGSKAFEGPYQDLILNIQGLLLQLAKLLKALFSPIEQYTDTPSLSRLNDLGDLFRKLQPNDQVQISGDVIDKQLNKLIEQLKNTLGLTVQVQNFTEEQQENAQKWHLESEEQFQQQNYNEALKLIEKAIEIDPENSQYLLKKEIYVAKLNEKVEEKIEIPQKSEIRQNQAQISLTQSEIFTTQQFEQEKPTIKDNLGSSQKLEQDNREQRFQKRIDIAQNIVKSSLKLFKQKKK